MNIVAGVAPTLPARRNAGGGMGTDFDCDGGLVAHTLRGDGFDASEDGTGRGTPLTVSYCLNAKGGGGRLDGESETLIPITGAAFDVAATINASIGEQTGQDARNGNLIAFDTTQITSAANRSNPRPGDPCHPLVAGGHAPAIAFQERGREGGRSLEIGGDVAYALTAPAAGGRAQERNIASGAAVRRLMPIECERLMGFPDNYTAITWRGKPAADGPRYKALGNSWAVNCARWIGRRIEAVESIKPHNNASAEFPQIQIPGRA